MPGDGHGNSLHASAQYSEYNERFDFMLKTTNTPVLNSNSILLVRVFFQTFVLRVRQNWSIQRSIHTQLESKLQALKVLRRRVARNSQWGDCLGVWVRSPQPPEANGGLGAKPPAAGGWGSGVKAPSNRRHGGLGAEPPALENFAFFAKIT